MHDAGDGENIVTRGGNGQYEYGKGRGKAGIERVFAAMASTEVQTAGCTGANIDLIVGMQGTCLFKNGVERIETGAHAETGSARASEAGAGRWACSPREDVMALGMKQRSARAACGG